MPDFSRILSHRWGEREKERKREPFIVEMANHPLLVFPYFIHIRPVWSHRVVRVTSPSCFALFCLPSQQWPDEILFQPTVQRLFFYHRSTCILSTLSPKTVVVSSVWEGFIVWWVSVEFWCFSSHQAKKKPQTNIRWMPLLFVVGVIVYVLSHQTRTTTNQQTSGVYHVSFVLFSWCYGPRWTLDLVKKANQNAGTVGHIGVP